MKQHLSMAKGERHKTQLFYLLVIGLILCSTVQTGMLQEIIGNIYTIVPVAFSFLIHGFFKIPFAFIYSVVLLEFY